MNAPTCAEIQSPIARRVFHSPLVDFMHSEARVLGELCTTLQRHVCDQIEVALRKAIIDQVGYMPSPSHLATWGRCIIFMDGQNELSREFQYQSKTLLRIVPFYDENRHVSGVKIELPRVK